jgi:hypothetical protein
MAIILADSGVSASRSNIEYCTGVGRNGMFAGETGFKSGPNTASYGASTSDGTPLMVKHNRPHRREPPIPKELRNEVIQHARSLARRYRNLFAADRELKDRVLRLVGALLPPRPRRRGRPGNQKVTQALRLLGRLRRQYPEENSRQHWTRVDDAIVIPNLHVLTDAERESAKLQLRDRVRWRLRKRSRKIRTEISIS